jgi:hypothetical protein
MGRSLANALSTTSRRMQIIPGLPADHELNIA